MTLGRRKLLQATGAVALTAAPLPFLLGRVDSRERDSGTLTVDPAGVLDLPPGFSYRILEREGERMSDGNRVPARPDGMACFAGEPGSLILMRNHELERTLSQAGYEVSPAQAYDPSAFGGVTRLVLEASSLSRRSSNRVLTGTLRNCAGGPSPWGWLSCEESVESGHGYVFRCRSDLDRVSSAERLTGYGRFNHEAVCIDPRTLTAYLTEDRPDGSFYRYQPLDPARPHDSGTLQALCLVGSPAIDTGAGFPRREKMRVSWVNVPEPDPKNDTVRLQARSAGAAKIRRGEGIAYHAGAIYFSATNGGARGCGQIWRLEPKRSGDELELLFESDDGGVLDMPDNICVTSWGDVLMAEDGPGTQYVRGLTPGGRVYDIARNALSRSEFAGICLAPGEDTLFFNMQVDGLTLAVKGPLQALGRAAAMAAHRS